MQEGAPEGEGVCPAAISHLFSALLQSKFLHYCMEIVASPHKSKKGLNQWSKPLLLYLSRITPPSGKCALHR